MSIGWVAGTVRARALLTARCRPATLARVAAAADPADAVAALQATAYRDELRDVVTVGGAERAVQRSLLWRLRVLAGWVPLEGSQAVRSLAAWFEICLIEERLAALSGVPQPPPLRLGRLGIAAQRVSAAGSVAAVRRALATSAWGDPGDMRAEALRLHLRIRWAARVRADVPSCAPLVTSALGLLAARERQAGRPLPAALTAVPAAGQAPEPDELWAAERRWWGDLTQTGRRLAAATIGSPEIVIGCCLLLAADAHAVTEALERAALGQARVTDAIA